MWTLPMCKLPTFLCHCQPPRMGITGVVFYLLNSYFYDVLYGQMRAICIPCLCLIFLTFIVLASLPFFYQPPGISITGLVIYLLASYFNVIQHGQMWTMSIPSPFPSSLLFIVQPPVSLWASWVQQNWVNILIAHFLCLCYPVWANVDHRYSLLPPAFHPLGCIPFSPSLSGWALQCLNFISLPLIFMLSCMGKCGPFVFPALA